MEPNNKSLVFKTPRGPWEYWRTGPYELISSGTDTINLVGYEEETKFGWNLPNFHKRKEAGELLPYTPYRKYKVTATYACNYALHYGVDGRNYYAEPAWVLPQAYCNFYISESEFSDYAAEYDTGEMVQRASAKIYDRGHDTLTFIAELNKTVALLNNARTALANLLWGKNPRQSWLEYRYGWRILYYDIEELISVMQNLDGSRQRLKERVGFGHHKEIETVNTYTDANHDFDVTSRTTLQVSLRGSVVADIDPPNFQFNPIITSWELIRFSFIIDWFVDVGTWLSSLSFLVLSTNSVAAAGIKLTGSRECFFSRWDARPNGSYNIGSVLTTTCEGSYVVRTPQTVGISTPIIPVKDILTGDIDTLTHRLTDLWALVGGTTRANRKRLRI